MKKKFLKIAILVSSVFLVICFVLFTLVWNGIILLNGLYAEKFDIKGVDVSSYQGDIEWNILASQNISFAFIMYQFPDLLNPFF